MKICMPTMENNGLNQKVHNHFGSANYFAIYDTEKKDVTYLENSNSHHNHGACQPLKVIANEDIDVVLTSGMGSRAIEMLNRGGIKTYLLNGETVIEAVNEFEQDKLKELTPEIGCSNHDCH